ncbi:hypothetical protein ACHAW5_007951 [Stephanodiscus triporus]|uniref:Uncharacterized protein n=1 Tax=Stephanodiscus triporus TaxID=2934178 RepID=A0ABD3NGG9_9STRA
MEAPFLPEKDLPTSKLFLSHRCTVASWPLTGMLGRGPKAWIACGAMNSPPESSSLSTSSDISSVQS